MGLEACEIVPSPKPPPTTRPGRFEGGAPSGRSSSSFPFAKESLANAAQPPLQTGQLPRFNPYSKITDFNARASPVDPGSFQDQILFRNSSFQCQISPSRSRHLPRSNPCQKQPLSMPGLPQSIQVASKIKSLFENNSFQCQNSPSRSRQLPRSNL